MFKKVLMTSAVFLFCCSVQADEAAVDCVMVDRAELANKSLIWRAPINSKSIFFECVKLESEKDRRKYYVTSPMVEAKSGCGHSYVSLNPELTNVFDAPEPEISYYFYILYQDVCPQFSVDRYAKFPDAMNSMNMEKLYRSLNELFLGIFSSRSGFEANFSKMKFWRRWLGDFTTFRDVVLRSVPIETNSIYVNDVSYCYDDVRNKYITDCISVNVRTPSSGAWILRLLWREDELIPLRVDALF